MSLYYSRGEYKYFSLALTFVAIPYLMHIYSTFIHIIHRSYYFLNDYLMCCCTILMLDMIKETYNSINNGVHSSHLLHIKLLETIVEGCPSSLLQLYVLIRRATDNETSFVANIYDIIVIISLCISKFGTSMCLSAYSSNKDQLDQILKNAYKGYLPAWTVSYVLFPLYHLSSEIFRLVTVCGLFLSLRAFGLLFLVPALLFRWILQLEKDYKKTFTIENITRLLLSLESDTLWCDNRPLTIKFQILTAIEGLIFILIMFYVNVYFNSSSYQNNMALVSLLAWICKSCLYFMTYFHIDNKQTNAPSDKENQPTKVRTDEERNIEFKETEKKIGDFAEIPNDEV